MPRRSASAYGPPGCGEGRVPRAPCSRRRGLRMRSATRPAPGAVGCPYIGKAEIRPNPPPEPHMCAECEDSARREIVLDTARGGAYYAILRQARKRLSGSRGDEPRRREP